MLPPRRAGLTVALLLVALAARAPFVGMKLCDEEGAVAAAVRRVALGHAPRFTIARTNDGREILGLPEHNLGGYVAPALLFAPLFHILDGDRDLDHRVATVPWLRLVYLAIYGAALALALLLLPPERRLLGALLLAAASLFALPLLASIQVQYDGAVSTLLLVAASLLLARAVEGDRLALAAVAGFVLSLGKLEYLCAGVATAVVAALTFRRPRLVVAYGLGALAGLALSAALDWDNFRAAYFVIGKFNGYQSATGLSRLQRIVLFVRQFRGDLWPLAAALAAVALSAPLVWARWRRLLFTLTPAVAVIGAYTLFAWRGDGFPRYFAPAFVLLPVALAQLWRPAWWSWLAATALLVAGLADFAGEARLGTSALARRVSNSADVVAAARALEARPRRCLPVTSWEASYYTVRAPFACWAYSAYAPALAKDVCR